MALTKWNDPNRPAPNAGNAVFDTSTGWHHAMIFSSADNVSAQGGEQIRVIHFGPPLESKDQNMEIMGETHWLGSLADLATEKLESIHAEATRMLQMVTPSVSALRDYDFSLHGVNHDDPNSTGLITIRASCSSLLEHCYEVEEVDLVDEGAVPEVESPERLSELVGLSVRLIERQISRSGLALPWPCRVLFPAYQMRAFEQRLEELPYRPQLKDHPFARANVSSPEEARGDEEDVDLE